jgi:hypothetical protein
MGGLDTIKEKMNDTRHQLKQTFDNIKERIQSTLSKTLTGGKSRKRRKSRKSRKSRKM